MILTICIVFVVYCIGLGSGICLYKANAIPYKKRYQDLLAIQNGDKPVPNPKTDEEKEIALLLSLTSAQRVDLEARRLEEGLDPIDPLTGLTGASVVRLKKMRYNYGYDG